jgi:DNA-binding NarL/FixJ family response regulator
VPKARILLADDNHAVLDHVSRLLRKDYCVVAAVNNGAFVLREFDRLRPDVIVLDISIGEPNGIELARQLRDSGCHSKIVFLTVHGDSEFVNAAMGSGASAYVVKSQLGNDLTSAISAALSGQLFVSPCLLYKRHEE